MKYSFYEDICFNVVCTICLNIEQNWFRLEGKWRLAVYED